jgi:uncharacterized OB-fold protein
MSSPIKAWREQKKINKNLGIQGKIISWTKILVPPYGFSSDAPYFLAIIKTNNNTLIGQIVDTNGNAPKTGQKVETVYRRQKKPDTEGIIYYGIKFRIL